MRDWNSIFVKPGTVDPTGKRGPMWYRVVAYNRSKNLRVVTAAHRKREQACSAISSYIR